MLKLICAVILPLSLGLACLAPPSHAAEDCVRSWSSTDYKSFAQVQAEVVARHRGAHIISVQLCGRGPAARIRVTIDVGREIRTLTINAK
jgi:hypothetical protein